MKITDYIPFGYKNAVTREQLMNLSGFGDRKIRDLIEAATKSGDIIINNGSGYYRPNPNSVDDMQGAKLYYITECHRIKAQSGKLKALKAFLNPPPKERKSKQIEGQMSLFDEVAE